MIARDADPPPARASRSALAIGLVLLLASVAFGTWARVHTALADANFDRADARGMLKSDPGLLYYFVERIAEADGLFPDDFRADPRVLHPLRTDIPARFAVGQELAVAWAYRALGGGVPLHVFCVLAMALWASLGAVGVFGLALELTRRAELAGLAAALFALLPANYRTIGFILVREDFSFPWLLLHLYLAARAVRVRTAGAVLACALALGVAAATWQASPFFIALEAACILLWFARTGENPLRAPVAWLLPAVLLAFSMAVPVLRADDFALSPPMAALFGLCAAALWSLRARKRASGVALAAASAVAVLALARARSAFAGGGLAEASHVYGLLAAKIRHLGRLPQDPRELSPEVRLMWQGPFETLDLTAWSEPAVLGLAALALALLVWTWRAWSRPSRAVEGVLLALVLISLPLAWLIARTAILTAALLPALAGAAAGRLRRGALPLALLVAAQGLVFAGFLRTHRITWYLPPERQRELAQLVSRLPALVPEGEAVAADFMNSTAILAHTRRPIAVQPKYEDRLGRLRAARFFEAFFHGTPEDLRRLCVDELGCRHLLVDRYTLWHLARYAAGVPWSAREPAPGTAAASFLSRDQEVLESVPGFELLYRSPCGVAHADLAPSDFYRLYRLAPAH